MNSQLRHKILILASRELQYCKYKVHRQLDSHQHREILKHLAKNKQEKRSSF